MITRAKPASVVAALAAAVPHDAIKGLRVAVGRAHVPDPDPDPVEGVPTRGHHVEVLLGHGAVERHHEEVVGADRRCVGGEVGLRCVDGLQ